jgi:hypothetical protein
MLLWGSLGSCFFCSFQQNEIARSIWLSFFSLRRFFLAVLSLLWLSFKASFIQFIKFNRVLSDSVKQSGWLGFSEDADSVAALTMCSSKLFIMSEGVA